MKLLSGHILYLNNGYANFSVYMYMYIIYQYFYKNIGNSFIKKEVILLYGTWINKSYIFFRIPLLYWDFNLE